MLFSFLRTLLGLVTVSPSCIMAVTAGLHFTAWLMTCLRMAILRVMWAATWPVQRESSLFLTRGECWFEMIYDMLYSCLELAREGSFSVLIIQILVGCLSSVLEVITQVNREQSKVEWCQLTIFGKNVLVVKRSAPLVSVSAMVNSESRVTVNTPGQKEGYLLIPNCIILFM